MIKNIWRPRSLIKWRLWLRRDFPPAQTHIYKKFWEGSFGECQHARDVFKQELDGGGFERGWRSRLCFGGNRSSRHCFLLELDLRSQKEMRLTCRFGRNQGYHRRRLCSWRKLPRLDRLLLLVCFFVSGVASRDSEEIFLWKSLETYITPHQDHWEIHSHENPSVRTLTSPSSSQYMSKMPL